MVYIQKKSYRTYEFFVIITIPIFPLYAHLHFFKFKYTQFHFNMKTFFIKKKNNSIHDNYIISKTKQTSNNFFFYQIFIL